MSKRQNNLVEKHEEVTIDKFVPSGQTIGTLADGRKIFIWGGLPGEDVRVLLTKNKKKYAQGIVTEVLGGSTQREEPRDDAYLSTSPWQIVPWEIENTTKLALLKESFEQEDMPDIDFDWTSGKKQWQYRNKMEFSFWWDHDSGLELAFHKRGTRTKVAVNGSALAMEPINVQAVEFLKRIKSLDYQARQLKTVIFRATKQGSVFAVLYVKDQKVRLPASLQGGLEGLRVYYSNPRSPASVPTKLLKEYGQNEMFDLVNSKRFKYSAESFFQVNIEVYEKALEKIKYYVERSKAEKIIDLYSGVGSIGVSVGATVLVEQDSVSAKYAEQNADEDIEIIQSPSEKVTDIIRGSELLIVDPPRAGLHYNVVEEINKEQPQNIIYLSCNPATQARDIALLNGYTIKHANGYNFFPKTPHIESLLYLERS